MEGDDGDEDDLRIFWYH